jgi:hypothetical protein
MPTSVHSRLERQKHHERCGTGHGVPRGCSVLHLAPSHRFRRHLSGARTTVSKSGLQRRPSLRYGWLYQLYHELDLLPDVHIAGEDRECGNFAIHDAIVTQAVRYSIMNDYTLSLNLSNCRPAYLTGDTAVRWMLDIKQGFRNATSDLGELDGKLSLVICSARKATEKPCSTLLRTTTSAKTIRMRRRRGGSRRTLGALIYNCSKSHCHSTYQPYRRTFSSSWQHTMETWIGTHACGDRSKSSERWFAASAASTTTSSLRSGGPSNRKQKGLLSWRGRSMPDSS